MTEERMACCALYDLDGTITKDDCYLGFLCYMLLRRPVRWMRIPILAMGVLMYKIGFKDNSWLKVFFLKHVLEGLKKDDVTRHVACFLNKTLPRTIKPKAVQSIKNHQERGDYLILLTASLDLYAEAIGKQLGFHQVISTKAERDAVGTITGRLNQENCHGKTKAIHLLSLKKKWPNICFIAYTDHHSDIPMVEEADTSVAVNPDKRLRAYAITHNIPCEDWN
ncbi:MAG: HAD-IB family hydrolase [Deltaproteobacteria bacterium]|jgi:phosphatidylglycerophosphatase C|nr:HAD-IB family hydrolase [Deltaproteobacteria bacterium]